MVEHSSELNTVTDRVIGTTLDGKFELLSLLGSGGAGSVYKARQIQLDRIVAVKLLHESIPAAGKTDIQRFHREAAVLERLTHPNIVKFYSFSMTALGRPYAVLEYLEGKNLADELRDTGGLSPDACKPIICELLEAIGFAHQLGIVHRDLKPTNVFLVQAPDTVSPPTVKILDFGLAKILDEELASKQKVTKTGALLGTPLYMSPEQCAGQPATAASDIYSIGCIIYECLTGKPPFAGESYYEVLMAQIETTAQPMLNSEGKPLPDAIQDVIAKALHKNPAERYASACEFRDAFESAIATVHTDPRSKRRHIRKQNTTARIPKSSALQLLLLAVLILTIPLFGPAMDFFSTKHKEKENTEAIKIARDGHEAATKQRFTTMRAKFTTALAMTNPGADYETMRAMSDSVRVINGIYHYSVVDLLPLRMRPDCTEDPAVFAEGNWLIDRFAERYPRSNPDFVRQAFSGCCMAALVDVLKPTIYRHVPVGGKTEEAAHYFLKAADILDDNDSRAPLSRSFNNFATIGTMITTRCREAVDKEKDPVKAQKLLRLWNTVSTRLLSMWERSPATRTPTFYDAKYALADVLMRQRDYKAAVANLEPILQFQRMAKQPDPSFCYLIRSQLIYCLLMAGQFERAETEATILLTQVNSKVGDRFIPHHYRGWALVKMKRAAEAEAELQAGIMHMKESKQASAEMACDTTLLYSEALCLQGKYKLALPIAENAVKHLKKIADQKYSSSAGAKAEQAQLMVNQINQVLKHSGK